MEDESEPSNITGDSSREDIARLFSGAELPTVAVFDPETVQGVGGVAVVRSMEAEEESGKAEEPVKPKRLERVMRPASLATSKVVEGVRPAIRSGKQRPGRSLPRALEGAIAQMSRDTHSSGSGDVAPGT